jgi:hypothetical protein
MENFTRTVNADGSIEYFNNSVVENIVINHPIPQDIASLSSEELEVFILDSHKNFIRQERDKKLLECDWTQSSDSPLTEQKRNEWKTYRQELRDMVNNINNITEVSWPVKP